MALSDRCASTCQHLFQVAVPVRAAEAASSGAAAAAAVPHLAELHTCKDTRLVALSFSLIFTFSHSFSDIFLYPHVSDSWCDQLKLV